MKNKIAISALFFFVHTQSSQELCLSSEGHIGQQVQSQVAVLETALSVVELQHLVLGYLNAWECRETLPFADTSGINSIVFSPDGECLVSCDRVFIKIWKYTNKQWVCIQTLKQSDRTVFSVIFSSDGKHLISGGADDRVTIWHQNINKQWEFEQALDRNENLIASIAISPDGQYLAVGIGNATNPTLRIWKQDNNKWLCIQEDKSTQGRLLRPNQIEVIFSPDGRYLAFCGCWKNLIKICQKDTDKWSCAQILEGHKDTIKSFAFSPNGKDLASGSCDKTIKIWQQDKDNKWTCAQTLEDHTHAIMSVAFSSNGKYLVSGSWDKTIKIWQQDQNNKWTSIQTLEDHTGPVTSVIFSPNGEYIASTSFDKTIKIWRNQKLEILDQSNQEKKDNHEK